MIEIKVGQIWQVCTETFWSSKEDGNKLNGRFIRTKLNRDEYIEIRYPFAWHFRTVDNKYLHAEPSDIAQNCRLIGKINEDVRFSNGKKLQQILDEHLYLAVWE